MTEDTNNHTKPSICFVSLDNFATLVDDPKFGHVGGAEMQQALIGRNLAKRGYRVSFLTLDHGQDNEVEIDGMRIIKAYDQNMGIPVLRFLYPRLASLWRSMRRADADIYYQRTSDSITGIVAAFCRWYRRKFVFAIAHNYDCITDTPYCPGRHERVLYFYGLRRANLVIAQTVTQQKLLRDNFGIDSTVIPNCASDHGRCLGGADAPASARGRRLLWIGAFKPAKRLELLLDIAERLQDLQFDVVGDGNSESEYVQRLRSRAKSIPNVHLHGTVPHAEMKKVYCRSRILCCTSEYEGFPNTFVEAWSLGIPVVSTFDPDGVITTNGLGFVAQDVEEIVTCLREIVRSPEIWLRVSSAVKQYYQAHHTPEICLPIFERLILDVVGYSS